MSHPSINRSTNTSGRTSSPRRENADPARPEGDIEEEVPHEPGRQKRSIRPTEAIGLVTALVRRVVVPVCVAIHARCSPATGEGPAVLHLCISGVHIDRLDAELRRRAARRQRARWCLVAWHGLAARRLARMIARGHDIHGWYRIRVECAASTTLAGQDNCRRTRYPAHRSSKTS